MHNHDSFITRRRVLTMLSLTACPARGAEVGATEPLPGPDSGLTARRLVEDPIIRPDMLPGKDGQNINGPSLIRLPDWVPNPLGRYYLYFAHHHGAYIRLAYADDLRGPWTVHQPGTLHLKDAPGARGHIASPDVHVDEERKQIRMYFHAPSKKSGRQMSFVATSADGLGFKASEEELGIFYFRVFPYGEHWYAMAKGGALYRSRDGLSAFQPGGNPFPSIANQDPDHNQPGSVRHAALHHRGDTLDVYYSRIGDAPESILRSRIDLRPGWTQWKASEPTLILKPEKDWEGRDLPIHPSKAGASRGREHALRDPAIFIEAGRVHLLYSTAGESGLAIAEILDAGKTP